MKGTCGVINDLSMVNDQSRGKNTQSQNYPGTLPPYNQQFNGQFPQFNLQYPEFPQFNNKFPQFVSPNNQINPQNSPNFQNSQPSTTNTNMGSSSEIPVEDLSTTVNPLIQSTQGPEANKDSSTTWSGTVDDTEMSDMNGDAFTEPR